MIVGDRGDWEALLEVSDANEELTVITTLVRDLSFEFCSPVAATIVPRSCVGFISPGIAHVDKSFNDLPTLVLELVAP